MSEAAEPRWELLPHDPQQFFDLPDEYDLGDLKRSYNRLIRRFKPEKFPAEFQRIRAAYEELNGALRYNISLRPPPTPRRQEPRKQSPRTEIPPPSASTPELPAPTPSEETPSPAFNAPVAETPAASQPDATDDAEVQPHDVDEILRATVVPPPAEDVPHETYARLKYQEFKSADDYITLALLADVVNPHTAAGHDESFLDWLFAGLAEHPRSWKVTALLRQYVASEHDPQQIVALLLRTVEVLPSDRFQYVTEQAWDRLLRESSFDEFRDCLDRCGARLGRAVDHSQLVFYVHILKFAMWKADAEFLDGLVGTIEDHYHQLDRYAQGEFEMLAVLREYLDQRAAFVARGPCCARIDQAIRDWCLLSEAAGDLSVLDCQYFINGRGKRLCEEFPDAATDLSFVLVPWDRIVGDVCERLDEPGQADMDELSGHARDFLIRHSRRLSRTLRNNVGTLLMLFAFGLFLIVVVATISFIVRSFMYFYEWRWVAGILDWVYAGVTFVGGTLVALVMLFRTRRHTSFVYDHVRRDLITLFRVAALTTSDMADAIEQHEDAKYGDSDTISGSEIIAAGLRGDAALHFFSLAQICLRAADVEPEEAPLIIL